VFERIYRKEKSIIREETMKTLKDILKGMVIGIVSALIAEGILYCCYRIATETIIKTFGSVIAFGDMAWFLVLMFLGIGILSGVIGSLIMISKYLRKEGSEFAAI
jgi:cell division protein FtsX